MDLIKDIHCDGTKTYISGLTYVVDVIIIPENYEVKKGQENLFHSTGIDPTYPKKRHSKSAVIARKHVVIDFDIRSNFLNEFDEDCTDQDIKEYVDHFLEVLNNHDYLKHWRYIVYTGNGLHIYYVFKDPIKIAEADIEAFEAVSKNLAKLAGEVSKEVPDLSTCVLSQPVRMPGTINQKSGKEPKEARVLHYQDSYFPKKDWIESGRKILALRALEQKTFQENQAKKRFVGYSRMEEESPIEWANAHLDLGDLVARGKGWTKKLRSGTRGNVAGFYDSTGKSKGVIVIYPSEKPMGILVAESGTDHYTHLHGGDSFEFVAQEYCNGDKKEAIKYIKENYHI